MDADVNEGKNVSLEPPSVHIKHCVGRSALVEVGVPSAFLVLGEFQEGGRFFSH